MSPLKLRPLLVPLLYFFLINLLYSFFVFVSHVGSMIYCFFISSFSTAFAVITGTYTIFICMEIPITMTIMMTFFASSHYFVQKQETIFSQIALTFSFIFLIIFLFLNFVEKFISVLCSPLSSVFYIPLTCLYFPIRNFIFNCKRWYVPY